MEKKKQRKEEGRKEKNLDGDNVDDADKQAEQRRVAQVVAQQLQVRPLGKRAHEEIGHRPWMPAQRSKKRKKRGKKEKKGKKGEEKVKKREKQGVEYGEK
jgi:hypothetical protein